MSATAVKGQRFGDFAADVARRSYTELHGKPVTDQALRAAVNLDIRGIDILPEYLRIKKLLKDGVPLVLVTGGAGTGKSTLIRWLNHEYDGRIVLSAPTGLAARNIGGQTIHSLIGIPPAWIVDSDIKRRPNSPLVKADILVIDEISMVNANVLDAVDKWCRLNRKSHVPFGGLKVVLIGDMFQLPPIIKKDVAHLFEAKYSSPRFYAAHALRECSWEHVELTKQFRQSNEDFRHLLGNVRLGSDLPASLAALNKRVAATPGGPKDSVWLCPRNADVEQRNRQGLDALPGPTYSFQAEIKGRFREEQLPAPKDLVLKKGAQVILTTNSPNWVNGSHAEIYSITQNDEEESIRIRLQKDRKIYRLERNDWEQFEYRVNKDSGKIERSVVGIYNQFPLVLGWAMTIHKSQGLTLDRAHIDMGAKGAFATGQSYVALSRTRNIQDISLARELRLSDIKVDEEALMFQEALNERDQSDRTEATSGSKMGEDSNPHPASESESADLNSIRAQWAEFHRLALQNKEIEKQLSELRKIVEGQLGDSEVGTIDGTPVVTWKHSTATRIDVAKARKALTEAELARISTTSQRRTFRVL